MSKYKGELDKAGVTSFILTKYPEATVQGAVDKHGYKNTFIADAKSAIEAYGLLNPEGKDGTPHPASLIIAPDGKLIHIAVFPNFREREQISAILQAVQSHKEGNESQKSGTVDEKKGTIPKLSFQWPQPSQVAAGNKVSVNVQVDVPEGAHLYGTLETSAMVTRISAKTPAGIELLSTDIPEGKAKGLGIGKSFVVDGRVSLGANFEVAKTVAPGKYPIQMKANYQVCTDNACSLPRESQSSFILDVSAPSN